MVSPIALMIALDVVHPPAVSASLSFALRTENESNLGAALKPLKPIGRGICARLASTNYPSKGL